MAGPKGEKGFCPSCQLEIGAGTKHPCFYFQTKEKGLIVWHLLCRKCKEQL